MPKTKTRQNFEMLPQYLRIYPSIRKHRGVEAKFVNIAGKKDFTRILKCFHKIKELTPAFRHRGVEVEFVNIAENKDYTRILKYCHLKFLTKVSNIQK